MEKVRDPFPSILKIDWLVYQRMFSYCLANGAIECSGFGKIKRFTSRQKDEGFQLTDIKLLEQVNTGVHTSITDEALSRFIVSLARRKENPSEWYCWWHTHPDFQASFSNEDLDTILRLSKDSKLVAVVINNSGQMSARYDSKGVARELEPRLVPSTDTAIYRACKKELKEKAKTEPTRRYRYVYSKSKKEKPETEIFAPIGLGGPTEAIEVINEPYRGRGNRQFYGANIVEDGYFLD